MSGLRAVRVVHAERISRGERWRNLAAPVVLIGLLSLVFGAFEAEAVPPSITGILPSGVQVGTSTTVKLTGKFEGADCKVWTDDPALVFSQPDTAGHCTVMAGSLAARGIHLLRVVNREGASVPFRLSVGVAPVVPEKEPNDALEAAQPVTKLPAWIHGQLDKASDVDGYSVNLRKGIPVLARLDAYALGSPVDCFLQVLNARGAQLMTVSDARNLDPECVFTPPEDGAYVFRIAGFAHPPTADVAFAGGGGRTYQLTVSEAPVANRVFPAAVAVSGKTSVELCGFGIKEEQKKVELSSFSEGGNEDVGLVMPALAQGPISVVIARYPVQSFQASTEASGLDVQVPCVVGLRLMKGARNASLRVPMKAGEKMRARFWSRSIGLGIEGRLSVIGPDEQQIAVNEFPADVFAEPSVSWSASKEGVYQLNVSSMFGGLESDRECVVELAAPAPSFAVTIPDGKPVRLEYGKTATFKAKVALANGWKDPLVARIQGLPEGVFAADVPVPEKGGEFDIVLNAAVNATPGTSPAVVSVWTKASPPIVASAQYPVRGDTMRGSSDTDFRREIWVTVGPPGSAAVAEPEKK